MKKNNYSIYLIENPAGKKYVGSTSCMNRRMNQYKNLCHKQQRKITDSIIEYGWDSHVVSILFECDDSKRFYYEAYFGNIYECIGDNGLNLSLPKVNDNWISKSDETKSILSQIKKGSIPWNKGIEFLSGSKNPMYGVKRSDEWKLKHSQRSKISNKKGSDHFKSKTVIDLEAGIFYDTCKEVSETYGIPYSTLKQRIRKNKMYKFIYA